MSECSIVRSFVGTISSFYLFLFSFLNFDAMNHVIYIACAEAWAQPHTNTLAMHWSLARIFLFLFLLKYAYTVVSSSRSVCLLANTQNTKQIMEHEWICYFAKIQSYDKFWFVNFSTRTKEKQKKKNYISMALNHSIFIQCL